MLPYYHLPRILLIQKAAFLTVSGDEGNCGTLFEEDCGGGNLTGLKAEFGGDLDKMFFDHGMGNSEWVIERLGDGGGKASATSNYLEGVFSLSQVNGAGWVSIRGLGLKTRNQFPKFFFIPSEKER